jgi:membrane protein
MLGHAGPIPATAGTKPGYTYRMPAPLELLKTTVTEWNADKAPRLAAALAFATIFAIAPLLIIVIAIVGQILGFAGSAHPHAQVEQQLVNQIASSVGTSGASAVRDMVDASFGKPRQTIVAQTIGWITFVIGASGLFAALQDALNTVWNVTPKKVSIWTLVRDRLASGAMLLVIAFLLLVSFVANTAISYVSSSFTSVLPFPGAGLAFAIVNWAVSLVVITVLFALMYRFLPDATVRWRDVWAGAALTAVLIVVGQALIGLYLGRAGVASAYGAAGSLLALLLWIYYSAMVLLFGAEFTKVYARSRGDEVDVHVTAPAAA